MTLVHALHEYDFYNAAVCCVPQEGLQGKAQSEVILGSQGDVHARVSDRTQVAACLKREDRHFRIGNELPFREEGRFDPVEASA